MTDKPYLLDLSNSNDEHNLILNFLKKLKKDNDAYVKSIEKKFGKSYEEILNDYPIKNWYETGLKTLQRDKLLIFYNCIYPKHDPDHLNRNISDSWGHYMTFKRIGGESYKFLENYIKSNSVKTGDEIIFEYGGCKNKVNILGVKHS